MITRTLKHRFVRPLVYLVCALMVLAGDPLLALDQNVRIVPKDDASDRLASWSHSAEELQQRLGTWWDGTWQTAWNALPESVLQDAPAARAATAFAQQDGAGNVEGGGSGEGESQGLTEEELRQLTLTDAVGFPEGEGEGVKNTPLPQIPGEKAGESSFRPPEELIRLMAGKATLDGAPLIPGWNLLSTPEEPADTDPSVVLSSIAGAYTRAYAYENCDTADPWKVYDPADLPNSDLTVLDHTKGFWLEATSAVELPFDGTLPATTDIPICPGWNLIGYPAGEPRHVTNALHTIEGKYIRVFGFDATDADDPWEVYSVGVPEWGNDLSLMYPGRGYWVLATEATTLTIANEGPDPIVDLISPADLDVVTDFTDVIGTVESPILESWRLTYERIGETEPIELATGVAPITAGELATFDPTLLVNGLYELTLEATDLDGRVVEDSIAVSVEGNMKLGHFTLSFIDLAVPLAGLDIEVVRTYDSRRKDELLDFGYGWILDIRQGSYQNNRLPGDGWEIVNPGGPLGLPCSQTIETKSHVTTITLSDQEIYRFRLRLTDQAALIGGCQARAYFEWVDGPIQGSTLDILGNDYVIYENSGDRLLDQDSFRVFEPDNVRLRTKDGRVFFLNIEDGVTRLEDVNGNAVDISLDGITHSTGVGIDFQRDSQGRIQQVEDLRGNSNFYTYDLDGDLVRFTDRASSETNFSYEQHLLEEMYSALGIRAVRTEYDSENRIIRIIDATGKEVNFEHDLDQRREVVTNRLGATRIMEFDSRGNVIKEIDENGAEMLRVYDGRDRLLSETDPLGRTVTNTYNGSGDLIRTVNSLGQIREFGYDAEGRVESIAGDRGVVLSWDYDGDGNPRLMRDALGNETIITTDSRGLVTRVTDPLGGEETYVYDGRGNTIRVTNPRGDVIEIGVDEMGDVIEERRDRTLADGSVETLVTSIERDSLGRPITVLHPDGSRTSATYDALGRVLTSTDRAGRVTTYVRDDSGRETSRKFPDGTSEDRVFDAEGRVVGAVDRSGQATTYDYDPAGRLVAITHPDGSVATQSFDAAGQLIEYKDVLGRSSTLAYDNGGRLVSKNDAAGRAYEFAYDADGNQNRVVDPEGNVFQSAYDLLGRQTELTYPDGSTVSTTYDALGRTLSTTDEEGSTTGFTYDSLGRLTEVRDPLGFATRYEYDEIGNKTAQVDANGRRITFEYDAQGRRTRTALPDGSIQTTQYSPAGTITSQSDFSGCTTQFQYDELGRVTRRDGCDGSSVEYRYTQLGRLAEVVDYRGTTQYSYDALNRLVARSDPDGSTVRYAYDAAGNILERSAEIGGVSQTTEYIYDSEDNLVELVDYQGGRFRFDYDLNGRRKGIQYPNGAETSISYDALGRLTGLLTSSPNGGVLQDITYAHNGRGQVSEVIEGDERVLYAYDAVGQLVRASTESLSGEALEDFVYEYDAVGNRLRAEHSSLGGVARVASYTYDERDRLVSKTDDGTDELYEWDANGNLLKKTRGSEVTQFGWNVYNALSSIQLPDGTEIVNRYRHDGVRVAREIRRPGEPDYSRTNFLIDDLHSVPEVLVEYGSPTEVDSSYVFAGTRLARGNSDGSFTYFHGDRLGSIRLLSDSAGLAADRFSSEPFGLSEQQEGEDENPYRFAGEYIEAAAGLSYNRARWVDLANGRFLSVDPAPGVEERPITYNRYVYANNDPVNVVDPRGTFGVSVGEVAMVAAIGATLGAIGSYIDVSLSGEGDPVEAAKIGFIVGAIFAPVALFTPLGPFLMTVGTIAGVVGAAEAILSGNFPLAVFRSASLLSGRGLFAWGGRVLRTAVNPKTFGVSFLMRIKDFRAGILNIGRYITNPVATRLTSILMKSGRFSGRSFGSGKSKYLDGEFMYVVDKFNNIIIGTRAGTRMPHPTLLGGWFPTIRAAGIVKFQGGKIKWVNNASGHFKPPARSLKAAQDAYEELPRSAFHPDFEGFLTWAGEVVSMIRW